ncbi:MAG: hypothetical protein RL266_1814 [Bacteroidota bacterium]|jgi:hypothetical protein
MRTLLACFLITSFSFTHLVNAQDATEIIFKGRVTVDYKNCKGAELTLCQFSAASPDCSEHAKMVTKSNGQFEFTLNRDNSYRVIVKKDGYVDRIIELNTTLPKVVADSKQTFEADVELTLYPEATEPVTVANVFFDAEKGKFDYTLPQK